MKSSEAVDLSFAVPFHLSFAAPPAEMKSVFVATQFVPSDIPPRLQGPSLRSLFHFL